MGNEIIAREMQVFFNVGSALTSLPPSTGKLVISLFRVARCICGWMHFVPS